MSGNLFRLEVDHGRRAFEFDDRRLRDRVADNLLKYDVTESESLLFGENFGVTPDVQTQPRRDALRGLALAQRGVRDPPPLRRLALPAAAARPGAPARRQFEG